MRRVLKDNSKTRAYLESLPKMYMVGCWAGYGVNDFPFTGKYIVKDGISIPLVYQYDDFNGTRSNWYLRPITRTTTGAVLIWTQHKSIAERIAKLLNKEKKNESK